MQISKSPLIRLGPLTVFVAIWLYVFAIVVLLNVVGSSFHAMMDAMLRKRWSSNPYPYTFAFAALIVSTQCTLGLVLAVAPPQTLRGNLVASFDTSDARYIPQTTPPQKSPVVAPPHVAPPQVAPPQVAPPQAVPPQTSRIAVPPQAAAPQAATPQAAVPQAATPQAATPQVVTPQTGPYSLQPGHLIGDQKGPFIAIMDGLKWFAKLILGKHFQEWYLDFKLWLGGSLFLFYWGRWLTYGYTGEVFEEKAMFVLGGDLILMSFLQYFPTYGWTSPVGVGEKSGFATPTFHS